ncbi:cytochrome P450 like protein [Zymoseptoria brevis]|uniref:Cytochrome P450 like protein n=1 Tax=Zymoseptoria brevis TaxID=1047168 RepID=A0A0F4GB87_9PEZI|nr:cytochrome P450 like protein [Zymoseptoria brevis]
MRESTATWKSFETALPALKILIVVIVLTYAIKHALRAYFGSLARVPGPRLRAVTVLPHLYSMWNGSEAKTVARLHGQYGPVVRLAPDLVSFIGEGKVWRKIYATRSEGFSAFTKDLLFYDKPLNNVPGPFSTEDPDNARMRKALAPAFSEHALKQYDARFTHWCAMLRRKLGESVDKETPVDMVKMFNCTTFDILSDMMLSEPLNMLEDGEYVPFVANIFAILKHVTRFKTLRYLNRGFAEGLQRLLMLVPAIRRFPEKHHHFVCAQVDKRLNRTQKSDIWAFVTADSAAASTIEREERYSIANEFMIAGTETSATTLSGLLYLLLCNPAWLSRLTMDLRAQFSGVEEIFMTALQSNKILDAVLKEGMRVYPAVPVGFARYVPRGGTEIEGYFMPEGTRVAIYHLATYRDENLWRHPGSFRPERWLGDDDFKQDHLDSFMPFSTGPRVCIGKSFAMHEMRLILATLLVSFDVELHPDSEGWMDQQQNYLVWEKPPLYVKLKPVGSS